MARGNTILYMNDTAAVGGLKGSGSKAVAHDNVIFALRKFTGGMGDEDEDQPVEASSELRAAVSRLVACEHRLAKARRGPPDLAGLATALAPRLDTEHLVRCALGPADRQAPLALLRSTETPENSWRMTRRSARVSTRCALAEL